MMNVVSKRARIWVSIGALAILGGCADASKTDRPATYPVSGTVTYKGEPVADATVSFVLADGSSSATGKTDASGKYSLMTFEPDDGAVPGEYNVSVVKYDQAAAETAATEEEEYVPPVEGAEESAPAAQSLLPAKYANPVSSGLKATVTEGPNTVDLQLADE